MNVRSICLAILMSGDKSGYDIRKASTDGGYSFFVVASFGSIYPALNRMEFEGLVTCRHEAQEGKPARKVYSITDAGRKTFFDELCQPHKPDHFRSEFLLIALYARWIGPEATREAIDRQIAHLRAEIALIDSCDHGKEDHAEHVELMENGSCPVEALEMMSDTARWTQNYGRYCLGAGIDYLEKHGDELVETARLGVPSS